MKPYQRRHVQVMATPLKHELTMMSKAGQLETFPVGSWRVVEADGSMFIYSEEQFKRDFEPLKEAT